MTPFQHFARTDLIFGMGALSQLGELARGMGFERTLLVADPGMVDAGYVACAEQFLRAAGIDVFGFHEFSENPTSAHIAAGRAFAEPLRVNSIVGLGGGSSMDCAKGINFVLTNGGRIQDYWGYGKAARPMLPMIGVPTTTGTGSEGQSYALISDAETHAKMACGAPGAAFRAVVLDPHVVLSQPRSVLAAAGYDAISHAVETFVTRDRNYLSDCYAREAWRLLHRNFELLLVKRDDESAASAMQVGAHLAGKAIEHSMLGAAHACANPITARYGATHGVAIAVMLPQVVRWNAAVFGGRYAELHSDLPARLEDLAAFAGHPRRLRELGVHRQALPQLAEDAATQWTGRFNPRPFNAAAALELYTCAY
jgi:alcohol dehydrogenase